MSFYDSMASNGLVRPIHGRVLGGVCAGLGRRFGIEPWPARLLFILGLMVLPGSQLLIYPILWILMPSEVRHQPYPPHAQPYPYAPQAQPYAQPYPAPAPGTPSTPAPATPPAPEGHQPQS